MLRRQFLKGFLGAIGVGAASGVPPLLRINTTLFSEARAQEPCAEDTCATQDNCGESDTLGHTCEVRDVCDVDASGDCKNDECVMDSSGKCENDLCEADSSGACTNDSCTSDKSGECIGDTCVSDKSGECESDECVSDSSLRCTSDVCKSDSSGECANDTCRSDSSGSCSGDSCTSDSSGACTGDTCVADSSGACNGDNCISDSSGYCTGDECVSDSSGECENDTCVSDSSGQCTIDSCTADSSGACGGDSCTSDSAAACSVDECYSDSSGDCNVDRCVVDSSGDCRQIDVCVFDSSADCDSDLCRDDRNPDTCVTSDTCSLDHVPSEGASHQGATGLNQALRRLYDLSVVLLVIGLGCGVSRGQTAIDATMAVFDPKPAFLVSQPVSVPSPVGPFLRDCDNDGVLEADVNGDGRCEGDPKVLDYRSVGTRELPAGTSFTGTFDFTCFHIPDDVSIQVTGPLTVRASHQIAIFGTLRLASGAELSSLGLIDIRTSAWMSQPGTLRFSTALSGEIKEGSTASAGEDWSRLPSEAVSPREGTLGTVLTLKGYCRFGSKKGKVTIGGAAAKVSGWTTDTIGGLIGKIPATGVGSYDLVVLAKEPKGVLPLTLKGAFTVKSPEITTANPHGAAESEVMLEGKFFGTKKGKVSLDIDGKPRSCKVTAWEMDPATGASRARFLIPKGLAAGSYPLRLTNKIGTAELSFGVD
jgi:hypothetical protein